MGTAYLTEIFVAWYSGNEYEIFTFFHNRITGEFTTQFWGMFIFNAIVPQLMWFKKIRSNLLIVFIISILINVGMWFERFVIIVTSLHRDFLPSSWAMFTPTLYDIGDYLFTFGFFFTAFFLFAKFFPVINMAEVNAALLADAVEFNDGILCNALQGDSVLSGASDGTINLTGNDQITYTGLEPVDMTGSTVVRGYISMATRSSVWNISLSMADGGAAGR